jgi:putative oxidoreductase
MNRFLAFSRSLGLLIARLGLGGILLLHGTRRWQAGVQAQTDYLTQFDTPYANAAAWGAISFEVVGGVLLVLGALTPLVGLGVLVQQVLTICYTNYYRGPDLLHVDGSYSGGYEYNVALGLLGLLFLVLGGGAVSLDRVLRRKKTTTEDAVDPSPAPERIGV